MSNILHFLMAIKLAAAYVEQMQTRIILKSDVEFNIWYNNGENAIKARK